MIKNLSTRVKELRIANNLTQKDLARHIGISESMVQSIECGRRNTSINTVVEMANFFNVSIDYLVARTDIPTRL